MEGIRKHSAVKINSEVRIWTWIARIIPLAYIPVSIANYFYDFTQIFDIFIIFLSLVTPIIAISWWYWAMDIMKWLAEMQEHNLHSTQVILEELKNIRLTYKPKNNE